jgi:hypothetical protein
VVGVAQQRLNLVSVLRAASMLIVVLATVVSLVAMHSVAASVGTSVSASVSASDISNSDQSEANTNAHTAAHADVIPHDAGGSSVAVWPCTGQGESDSSSVMSECAPLASLGGLTAVAQLRAECAEIAPHSPLAPQRTGTVAQPTAPSLHVLSISRT